MFYLSVLYNIYTNLRICFLSTNYQTILKYCTNTNLLMKQFISDTTLKHWVKKYGWKEESKSIIFIANQDENIKTKNITEKIDFENVAGLMAACL